MKKRFAVLIAAGVMTLCASFPAFAGEWKQDNTGWWWQRDDGSCPKDQWEWVDGNQDGLSECYYFDSNGYMLTNTTTPDGYTVNEGGAWVENGYTKMQKNGRSAAKTGGLTVVAPENYYFAQDETGAIVALHPQGENMIYANVNAVENAQYLNYVTEEYKEKIMDAAAELVLGEQNQKDKVTLNSGAWYRYTMTQSDSKLAVYMRIVGNEIQALTVTCISADGDTDALVNAAVS